MAGGGGGRGEQSSALGQGGRTAGDAVFPCRYVVRRFSLRNGVRVPGQLGAQAGCVVCVVCVAAFGLRFASPFSAANAGGRAALLISSTEQRPERQMYAGRVPGLLGL